MVVYKYNIKSTSQGGTHMQKNQYKIYISSLKGFACFFVMMGHYIGLIKYSPDLSEKFPLLNFFKTIHLDLLYNESFWLQLFFVVSGYLLAQSTIKTMRGFVVKTIIRFLRLGIPIFFANCIIIILYYLIGFKNSDTRVLFLNDWFQNFYTADLNLLLLLKSPFDTLLFSKCYFNPTYWVLKDMFIASIAIYVFLYIKSKIKRNTISTFIYLILLLLGLAFSNMTFACMTGLGLALCEQTIHKHLNQAAAICILTGSFLLCIILKKEYTIIFFFFNLVLLCPKISWLNRFLNTPFFDRVGKISFGIYVFHWPVICSIGSVVILTLTPKIGFITALFITMIISITLSIGLAIIFNKTAEKWCGQAINWLQAKLTKKRCRYVR